MHLNTTKTYKTAIIVSCILICTSVYAYFAPYHLNIFKTEQFAESSLLGYADDSTNKNAGRHLAVSKKQSIKGTSINDATARLVDPTSCIDINIRKGDAIDRTVAVWPFDNSFDDVDGDVNGINRPPASSNNVSLDTSLGNFKVGAASLNFNGGNGIQGNGAGVRYNFLAPPTSADSKYPEFSIGFWIKPNSISTQQVVFESGNTTDGIGILLRANGNMRISISKAGNPPVTIDFPFPDTKWHHVTYTYKDGNITAYLDGATMILNEPLGRGSQLNNYSESAGSGFGNIFGNSFLSTEAPAAVPFVGHIDDAFFSYQAIPSKDIVFYYGCINPLVDAGCPLEAFQSAGGEWASINLSSGRSIPGVVKGTVEINGAGFNEIDGSIYSLRRASADLIITEVILNPNFNPLSINNKHKYTFVNRNIGAINGLPAVNYNTGDVFNGVLYVKNSTTPTIQKIDVNPNSPTYLQLLGSIAISSNFTASNSTADFAITTEGKLFVVTDNKKLFKIDLINGNALKLGTVNYGNTELGAQFVDANGFFYGIKNSSGKIIRINLASLDGVLVDTDATIPFLDFSNSIAASNNDGARCASAPLPIDFGDAPDSYTTRAATQGASATRHTVIDYDISTNTSPLMIGTKVDIETDAAALLGTNADGDDLNNIDDEDAFSQQLPPVNPASLTYSITVPVTNNTSNTANLYGWIDFNGNGTFDANFEFATKTVPANTGLSDILLTWTWTTANSSNIVPNPSYLRLRLTSDILVASSSFGSAEDGEIEDYSINLSCTPASIAYDSASFCNIGTTTVTQTGPTGGTYSSTAGLAIDSSSGEVNLTNSTPGSYTIIYTYSSGNCSTSTDVTINETPAADEPVDVVACDSYTLPDLVVGNYFTGAGGTGTALFADDEISQTQTIFVYAETGTTPNCSTENSFTVTINETPAADEPVDVVACDSYTLPDLVVGNYFTGADGTGTALFADDEISQTQTIFVYAETGTTPNCSTENSFTVTINETPAADEPVDVVACDSYTLPDLVVGNYFTGADGTGTALFADDEISQTQTIFVYAETGTTPNCSTENSFTVTINETPAADEPVDVVACDSYTLPDLVVGNYFTGADGTGTALFADDEISQTQTIFVYAETGTTPNCSTENSFTVTINETPAADEPVDVVACDSYTLPDLVVGNYFTGADGTGTALFADDEISQTQTIFVYAETGTTPNCSTENSFTVTINETPAADEPVDVVACDSYTLPDLVVGNYFTGADGTGTALFADDEISQTQTIFVYAETGTTPNCSTENSFTVTINETPAADEPVDVVACDSYTLPDLVVGNYFTGADGTGTALFADDEISQTQTIFVYAETGTTPNCSTENSFTVTINETPAADEPVDVVACDSYTLPDLVVGNYFTGADGTGTALFADDEISQTQTIFVYAETGTTPNCSTENSFTVTINETPAADEPVDVVACDSYTLPDLVVGNYFTGADGTGTALFADDEISQTQTIFVYAETGTTPNCSTENSFTVTINETPAADEPVDVVACDSYTLPDLVVGNYFTGADGTGTALFADDEISQTQTIFVYAETGTTPNCSTENSFTVTINETPAADEPVDVVACDSYTLPDLVVGNYFTGADGTGTALFADDEISQTQTIFVYAETGTTPNCSTENSFTVTINETPAADEPVDVVACDSYTLPDLVVGNYFTGADGTGTALFADDEISQTQTIFVYAETGTTPNCSTENSFTVTINETPAADEPVDVVACDSYTLPDLVVGNYFTGADGTGTALFADDEISQTQTIFVYAETGTTPNCSTENSFTVTINETPAADEPVDVVACDSYTLPDLVVGNYFTGADGTGTALFADDEISQTQTIFVYAETGTTPNCSTENSFTVTINETPAADEPVDVVACDSYTLPDLVVGNYFTGADGTGTALFADDEISQTQTIFVYAETGTTPNCSTENSFTVTINETPAADEPVDVVACDSYTLPDLVVGNYFTGADGTGTALFADDEISQTQTIFVYAETGTTPNCSTENSFTVTINETPAADEPVDVVACDSYTLPDLVVGNYFTGADGTGTALFADDEISQTQTIFVYAETGTTPNCSTENSFTVTINETPAADEPVDVVACDSYTLPDLVVGNYFTGADGTGTALFADDEISQTQTIFVYAETGTTPNCSTENSFTVTINETPAADEPVDVVACDSYTLPDLVVGNYFTGADGTGTALFADDEISQTQTIFVYAETGTTPNCSTENSFTVTINETPAADEPVDVVACDSYTLPDLVVGNYFTGADGTGTALFADDEISQTQTIFVYAETGTTPNCSTENSFTVTINETPAADEPVDVVACDSYTLPDLVVGNYFTGADGTGTALFADDEISQTQTIFVYAETGTTPNCSTENSFTVTINETPAADEPVDVVACDSYTLPDLVVGNYFTGADGTGTALFADDEISQTQTIFVYAETGTTPNCSTENSFTVTINETPAADEPVDVVACDSYTLPDLVVGNYFTGADGTGTALFADDEISQTQTIFVYAETGTTPNCSTENSFTVTINETPAADEPVDVVACDSYTLPDLVVGNYFTGADGTGTALFADDEISQTQTIFVYAETGTTPNCSTENSFTVTINETPAADEPVDVVACDSYTLPDLVVGNYFTGADGTGTALFADDEISQTQTIFVYAETGTTPNCSTENSFTVTINETPAADEPVDVVACDSYTLPDLVVGNYFTGADGTGTALFADDEISQTQTIFVYAETGTTPNCSTENSFTVTINETPAADEPVDVVACDSYTLPDLVVGNYFTGADGTGTALFADDEISQTQTIFVYAETGTTPNCSTENSFTVTINETPAADEPVDVVACDSYTLPDLVVGNYFTGADGTGTALFADDEISQTQTIFVYAETGTTPNCSTENSFTVTINETPAADEPVDVVACDSYTLPDLVVGNYFTGADGTGTALFADDEISQTQTIFVYAETGTTPNCSTENSFTVTINETPAADEPVDVVACDSYTLPDLVVGNYFTGADGTGTALFADDEISQTQTIFVYAETGTTPNCSTENSFTVTINETPAADEPVDVVACDSYTLPDLVVGNYFTGADGTGTALFADDEISQTQTIFVYAETGTTPNCSTENSFTVTINETPAADEPVDVVACDSYTLPDLVVGNYFTGADGTGTALFADDEISQTQTIFVYAETGTTPNCSTENSFTVTINETPAADEPVDVVACDSYTLPDLVVGNYFTGADGTGTALFADDEISQTQTIFVYAETGTTPNCSTENSFTVTINETPAADEPVDVVACDSYTLPDLVVGNYFTGADGTGTALFADDEISQTQTIFVYAETGTTPNCSTENSFTVTINETPAADEPVDVVACDSYTLPDLVVGNYFTGADGTGTALFADDEISQTQTIFVYAETGTTPNCSTENSFTVTINETPAADEPVDVVACDSYTLPDLVVGNYFTGADGTGTALFADDEISQTQTIFVYAETGTTPNCSTENSFTVTVNITPILTTATIDSPECGQETGSISVDSPQVGFEYTLINEADPTDIQTLIAVGVPAIVVFNNVGAGTYTVSAASPDGCMAELTGQIVNQAPVLIISCPPSITLECGDSIDPSNTGSVLVNSDCSNATITYIDTDLIGGCNAITGSFTRTFTVIDEFGNAEICEQTIIIEDTTAPQLFDEILTDIFTTCDAIPEAMTPLFVDDCDNNVSILFTETSTANECEYQYIIERTWIATDTCGNETSFNQIIHVTCPIVVYNGLSTNNDGNNEILRLEGIECYPENNVKIFNRWGVLVFEKDNYNNSNNAFRGISEGRMTIRKKEKLPTGIYFYIINYEFTAEDAPDILQQSGYLYINNN